MSVVTDRGRPFSVYNPWRFYGGVLVIVMLVASFTIGFIWVPSTQTLDPRDPSVTRSGGLWGTICRGLGWTSDARATRSPPPPDRWPFDVRWTADTTVILHSGRYSHGEYVFASCMACHASSGGSVGRFVPDLDGQDRQTVYKQLGDFRSGHRQGGVMNAVAAALSDTDMADAAAYFSARPRRVGTPPNSGNDVAQSDNFAHARRLVHAGAPPLRSVAACATCHGPRGYMTSAPLLGGQYPTYLEVQLGSFAQRIRVNDAHEQMRQIARGVTGEEVHILFQSYSQQRPEENHP